MLSLSLPLSVAAGLAEDCSATERACRSGWPSQPTPPEKQSGLVWWEQIVTGLHFLVSA
jgi:hypothetical protein